MPTNYPLPSFHVNGYRQYAYGYNADIAFQFTAQAGQLGKVGNDYAHMPTFWDASWTGAVPIAFAGFSAQTVVTFERYGGIGQSDHSTGIFHVADLLHHENDGYFLYHTASATSNMAAWYL